eukprot:g69118.t1
MQGKGFLMQSIQAGQHVSVKGSQVCETGLVFFDMRHNSEIHKTIFRPKFESWTQEYSQEHKRTLHLDVNAKLRKTREKALRRPAQRCRENEMYQSYCVRSGLSFAKMSTRSLSPRGGGDRSPRRRSRSRSPRSRSREFRGGGGGGRGGGGGKRKTGVASRWNEKGFGFIKPDDGGDDVFCHFSAIEDGNCLREGSKVEYEVEFDERKGKDRAERVTGGAQEDRRGGGGYGGGGGSGAAEAEAVVAEVVMAVAAAVMAVAAAVMAVVAAVMEVAVVAAAVEKGLATPGEMELATVGVRVAFLMTVPVAVVAVVAVAVVMMMIVGDTAVMIMGVPAIVMIVMTIVASAGTIVVAMIVAVAVVVTGTVIEVAVMNEEAVAVAVMIVGMIEGEGNVTERIGYCLAGMIDGTCWMPSCRREEFAISSLRLARTSLRELSLYERLYTTLTMSYR